MMVANKTDVLAYESLSQAARNSIEEVAARADAELITMSNVSEENVMALKNRACDKLLEARVDAKLSAGRMKDDVMSRITIAMPKLRKGSKARETFIPESVKTQGDGKMDTERVTEKQLMVANGGAGVYVCDYRKYYQLEDDEWKYDPIPEFMDGKNVMDFFDADIEERLRALEEEEATLEQQGAYAPEEDDEDDIDEEEMALFEAIKDKQAIARKASRVDKPNVPRKILSRNSRSEQDIKNQLEEVGLESEGVIEHTRGRKRARSAVREPGTDVHARYDDMDVEEEASRSKSRGPSRSESVHKKQFRVKSQSATRGTTATSLAPTQQKQVFKKVRSMERKIFREARRGEADREHYPKMVKHLNSGKRGLGTSTIGR
jgi:nucleolar GTP-binding protein